MSMESLPSRRTELTLFFGSLLLYVLLTIAADHPGMVWDEGRYHQYGQHLTQGFYAEPENPDIINGPGYPLVLAPMIAAGVPLIFQRMLNALLMAFAAWFSFRSVLPYAGRNGALVVALITVLHPSLARVAPYLMTEPLALFCITGFAWAFTSALRAETWRWSLILTAALSFGWLTLTRVFFGNVIMAGLVFFIGLLLVWKSQRARMLRALVVMGLALTMCLPWLAYTHSKTGETLCWSTVSGELLYWMTSTNEGENGHWFSVDDALNKPELAANHAEFFRHYYKLPVKEREEAFKKQAMANLRANPRGVLMNWISNGCRLLFGFPRSFQKEELLLALFIVVNAPLAIAALLALWIGSRKWRALPVEVLLLALLVFIYLGGSSLASALPRYAAVIWPWLGLGIAAVFAKCLRVRIE